MTRGLKLSLARAVAILALAVPAHVNGSPSASAHDVTPAASCKVFPYCQ